MFALALLTTLCADPGPDASRLAVIRTTTDFTLTTQADEPLRWDDLRGKVVLVSFVFTTCGGSCPATTHRMSQVAQALAGRGLLKDDRVRLVSITLDPARDTPEALRNYMRAYAADPAHWTFLTGPPEQVTKVHAAWGMWARPAAGGRLDHPSRVFLVDRSGRVREIYNLDFFKPAWVLEDVRSLLDEAAGIALDRRRRRSYHDDSHQLVQSQGRTSPLNAPQRPVEDPVMLSALLAGAVLLAADQTQATRPSPGPDDLSAYEAASARVGRDPDAHVKLALWCEAHGLAPERLKHLAIAVLTDPKNATARGLMGLVAYRGRWERPDAVGEKVRADAELGAALAEYNALRQSAPNTAEGHWRLALWCEKKGLEAEETAHLTAVTRLDPSRDAAWKRLGCKPYGGRWMTDEQIAAIKAEAEQQKRADRHWRPLLERWRDRLADKDRTRRASAEQALSEVNDPRAVPMVWSLFAAGDEPRQLVAARVLGQIDSGPASRALAALAVFSPSAHVRRVATETLGRRDPREFVSVLIGVVRDPIKYEVRPVEGLGSAGVLFIEGKQFNVQRVYTTQDIPLRALPPRLFDPSVPFDPGNPRNQWLAALATPAPLQAVAGQPAAVAGKVASAIPNAEAAAARRDADIAAIIGRYQQAAAVSQARLESDVAELEAANAVARRQNGRALPVLNAVTGQDLGESQDAWNVWWSDQQGYKYDVSEPENKPTFTQIIETPGTRVHHACFGAGTTVRTLDGPRPIESVRVGDRVLSQDVKTGGLSFEPVLAVFHNRPAPTLRIALDGEAVVATGIHRFWQASKGWTMARDLNPGDAIRTLDGLARVASVEDEAVQPVFNLEVARGRSFFVGRRGALVHDNSLVVPAPEPFDAAPALAALGRK